METRTLFFTSALFIGLIFILNIDLRGQNTPGELSFSVKTVTDNGNFAPKHVLAIWVEDDNGFVKSRLVRGNNRRKYLYTWKEVTGENTTDATTGATLPSHQTRTVSWDCTDLDGHIVPDGEYTIWVEFTEKHAQGPLTSVTFVKATEEVHLTPADEENFIDMALDFIPDVTGINEELPGELVHVYPNPGNGIFYFTSNLTGELCYEVYDNAGKRCATFKVNQSENGETRELDLTDLNSGIYFVKISNIKNSMIVKIIKQ